MDDCVVVGSEEMDASCYIVEAPLEIIEINESQNEDENLDVTEDNCNATKELEPENDSISEFLVIDETGADTVLNISTITNGDTKKSSEDPNDSTDICAPKTPQPTKTKSKNDGNNNGGDAERRVLIDIKFLNKKTYFAFHEEFIGVVKKYYRSKIDDMDILDDSAHHRLCISEKIVKKSESFLVDTTPKASEENETTPRYTLSVNTPVLSNLKRPREDETRLSMASNRCFNCDKDTHGLRDCPEPRNMSKIRKARNDFNRRELRYHDDNDESSLVPGKLSDELKVALGLSGNQIPLHVYKMRLYGYPPGWLEDAKVQHSGLQLFTGNDSKVRDEREKAFKFDVQKIHEFPGFNVPPEGQFVDKFRLLNVPPMMPEHSKDYFIKALGAQVINGYKKRKLNDRNVDSTVCDEVEMEIADDDDDEVIPLGQTCYPEPPPPGEEESEEGEISSDNNSQSSQDLERKKLKLLNAIAAEEDPQQSTKSRSCIDPVIIENSENENRDNSAKDIDIHEGHVEATVFGTPVLPSFSPFEILPAGDNFMEGVSDVIAFENLAESTGKYDNLRELIKKVRTFQKKHQEE